MGESGRLDVLRLIFPLKTDQPKPLNHSLIPPQDEFTDSTSIDREDFLLIFKKYKSFERVDISKSELKRVYHAIDKAAGGELAWRRFYLRASIFLSDLICLVRYRPPLTPNALQSSRFRVNQLQGHSPVHLTGGQENDEAAQPRPRRRRRRGHRQGSLGCLPNC